MAYFNQYLDDQYNNVLWTKKPEKTRKIVEDFLALGKRESEKARQTIDHHAKVPYGETEREYLAIFGAESLPGDAPIFVFIHGGYWNVGYIEMCEFLVAPMVKAGVLVVMLEYELAPKVSISTIVKQARQGIGHVLEMASTRKSKGVVLCGHSAGAHLAAMALADEQQQKVLQEHVRGALLVSGIYDLRPICQTGINDKVKMTESDAWQNSVTRVLETVSQTCTAKGVELIFALGGMESAEFIKQSTECKEKLEALGVKAKYMAVGDEDHFSVMENMQESDDILTQEALRLMGLKYM